MGYRVPIGGDCTESPWSGDEKNVREQ